MRASAANTTMSGSPPAPPTQGTVGAARIRELRAF
jgi:hypothetical protein